MERSHHRHITESVLDHSKQAQDNHGDVKEVDDDESPLVSQEVKHLLLQGCYLVGGGGGSVGAERRFRAPDDDSHCQLRLLSWLVLVS